MSIRWNVMLNTTAFSGSLVWGPDRHYGEVYNFQVQQYKGEDYLVFWAGDDSIGGHGEGKYYMVYRPHKQG